MSQATKLEFQKKDPRQGERLKEARQSLGLTQAELGKRLEYDSNYIYMLESGKKAFPKKLAGVLHDLENEVRKKFDHLPPKKSEEVRVIPDHDPDERIIKVYSFAAAGKLTGSAADYEDLANHLQESVRFNTKDPDAFALIIEGESMLPDYRPGDRVIFSPNSEPRSGDIVVARILEEGNVLFKVFRRKGEDGRRIILESLNPDYKPIQCDAANIRYAYPAIGVFRRIHR